MPFPGRSNWRTRGKATSTCKNRGRSWQKCWKKGRRLRCRRQAIVIPQSATVVPADTMDRMHTVLQGMRDTISKPDFFTTAHLIPSSHPSPGSRPSKLGSPRLPAEACRAYQRHQRQHRFPQRPKHRFRLWTGRAPKSTTSAPRWRQQSPCRHRQSKSSSCVDKAAKKVAAFLAVATPPHLRWGGC